MTMSNTLFYVLSANANASANSAVLLHKTRKTKIKWAKIMSEGQKVFVLLL